MEQNLKFEVKFFGLSQVFHREDKQTYKSELFTNRKTDKIFYVWLLE